MSFSGYKLWEIKSEYMEGERIYAGYAANYVETVKVGDIAEAAIVSAPISIDFDALFTENQDIVGWIYGENTPINYPIVQSDDNNYYLRRMLDGSYNIAGSIFMDYRNSPDFRDFNTIIYGHNLRTEDMFGSLKDYSNQSYYEKHPEMYLSTPDEDYKIELISGYKTDIYDHVYILPKTEEDLEILFDKLVEQSNFIADSSLQKGDKLITLSTCSDGPDTARYVLIGKITN